MHVDNTTIIAQRTEQTTINHMKRTSPPKHASPPVSTFKINRTDSSDSKKDAPEKKEKTKIVSEKEAISDESNAKKETLSVKETINEFNKTSDNKTVAKMPECNAKDKTEPRDGPENAANELAGVGDKIKKFEKAAEDAGGGGKVARTGSIRGKSRTERLGSDSKDDPSPPTDKTNTEQTNKNVNPSLKWQTSIETPTEEKIKKPEPQKIIRPEFKPLLSPVDVTIRSPSLGAKVSEQFSSHGTAFRNVHTSEQRDTSKVNEDNTQNNVKTCKPKSKEKTYSITKGSNYFSRGSEEIWLVKKKDIEEIEERVLDSFRRAGGSMCMRSESMRPSSDSGQGASLSHTMGRNKPPMYARSESLDPQHAGARAQTLKRQTSVACTCGHDKKPRAKSTGPAEVARPRTRSSGDENQQVLDKYETLV